MTFLTSALSFIVAIAILVAIHEYGHFWVARRCGVKVLKFSIGFGKPLWSKTGKDGVEYVIAAIPLGGYVKMLDEREGTVAPEQQHLAFNAQSVWKRIAIVVAGPVANFIFAIFAFAAVFLIGTDGLKPVLAEPKPGTVAAEARLLEKDQIIAVGDVPVESWQALAMELMTQGLSDRYLDLSVQRADDVRHVQLDANAIANDPENSIKSMGLAPWRPPIPAVIDEVKANSAAAEAGLQVGDKIVAIDGQPIQVWSRFAEVVQASPMKKIELQVLRDGREVSISIRPKAVDQIGYVGAGPVISDEVRQAWSTNQVIVQYGLSDSVSLAVKRTWDTSVTILTVLYKMVIGEASLKHLGGPINIAEHAGIAAKAGFVVFLSLLGFISVSLGVLNLLPVPVLDGGHLLYYICELFLGRPVSEATQAIGQRVGLAMIMLLMSVALFNDFSRLLQ